MARYLIPLGIFFGLVLLLGIGLGLNPREVPSPLIDKPAPAFTLPRVSDAEQTLSATDFLGKVSIFNVWASWCVACRQEHPLLVELSKTSEIPIYGLNYKDTRTEALRWLNQFGNPYRHSGFDADGKVGFDWGVYGVPETFIVDQLGVIRYKHIGPISQQDLQTKILPLIQRLQASR